MTENRKNTAGRLVSPERQKAQQQRHDRGLGGGRDESRHRRWGALIYIRCPQMEGNHAEFESDAGDGECDTRQQEREAGPAQRQIPGCSRTPLCRYRHR